jgi:hypothetical protein
MPDIWMDVDIAVASAPVNMMPLIDDTDFKTIEDGVVFNQSGLALFWNFTTTLGVTTVTAVTPTTGDDHDWTDFTTSGMYGIEIPVSGGDVNNDTEGVGHFTGFATGILPWRGPTIGFRAAAINDALLDSNTLLDSGDVGMMYQSTISTLNSQTSFDMADAFATDDVAIGNTCVLVDAGNSANFHTTWVSDLDQANNRIIINDASPWTTATSDTVRIHAFGHPGFHSNAQLSAFGVATKTNVRNNAQILGRSDADAIAGLATEIGEFNEVFSSGGGDYSLAADSQEAGVTKINAHDLKDDGTGGLKIGST